MTKTTTNESPFDGPIITMAESCGTAHAESASRAIDSTRATTRATIYVEPYIGRAIRIMRTKLKMRQADLACELAAVLASVVDQPYISDVESGKTGVSLDRLAAFAAALNCRASLLVEWAETIAEKEWRSKTVNAAGLVQVAKAELSRRGVVVDPDAEIVNRLAYALVAPEGAPVIDPDAEIVNKRVRPRVAPEGAPVTKRARTQSSTV